MVDYSETIEVYDIKVCIYCKLNETWRNACTRCQGHSLSFVQGHSELNWISDERYRTIGPLVLPTRMTLSFWSDRSGQTV